MTQVSRPEEHDGGNYESTYGKWIEFFRALALAPEPKRVVCPFSWAPLVHYMGHEVVECVYWFDEDYLEWPKDLDGLPLRRLVEISSACRPELVHALYEYDTNWTGQHHRRRHTFDKGMMPVTCNGSFFRPEVLAYLEWFKTYRPDYDTDGLTVLVPCAAVKPYPAPLHEAVRMVVDEPFTQIVATGVLGLVPETCWGTEPLYDSGMPYEWRLMTVVQEYFTREPHGNLVVYGDFNYPSIERGLASAGQQARFVPVWGKDASGYANLLSPRNLGSLLATCRQA
jgi:hypothetical protein